jgi:hypothetical protein
LKVESDALISSPKPNISAAVRHLIAMDRAKRRTTPAGEYIFQTGSENQIRTWNSVTGSTAISSGSVIDLTPRPKGKK